jgi:short-subunit dehydrogenase
MRNLKGAIALVTGASSGIGYAAARSLARRGAHVIATARRVERLQALAAEIGRMDGGAETLVLPADLNMDGEWERVAREAEAWKGRVDILVNNAGFGRIRFLDALDPARDILPQIHLDLVIPILLARALLPGMIARRSGCILNIGSVASLIAVPTFSIYSAAKYGLRGFNDALRREMKEYGVDVCLICPGPVRTEFGLHSGRQPGWEDAGSERTTVEAEVLGELIVKTAERPRRCVVIPWYYRLPAILSNHMPGFVDFLTDRFYARPLRKNGSVRRKNTGDESGRRV